MIADISSLKIGVVANRAVDMGTFIYPITSTLRRSGAQGARQVRRLHRGIVTAAVVNLFMAFYLQWAARAPTDVSYPLGGSQLSAVGPCSRRITMASIVAEVVSELVSTEVYHWLCDG